MAIKQRALKKLHTTKHRILRMMGAGSKAVLGGSCHDLAELRDLYREGLPQQYYAAYGEIFDGLILAVQTMIEDGEEDLQEDVFALCQELLEHLEKETAKETRFKKEIFFLPYKASMFDSLESVWRAACADREHCVAYVMPIPYADRNPDQTAAEWHCERDQFPKDVPTLDWQQVNLKAWHPDVIIYHNPYDNCNAVTSVDEQYYSRNLRHCADKLVYIPYFVLDEIEPGDKSVEESVAHFITAPGVLNADLIVVQSEKMRQVYINVLARHTDQGEEYWEEHISGAGAPKIEKVLTSKKEDFEMPKKWRRLVEGKKIILYNTSLTAMLQNSDKVCDKLRYVFDVFRNRDDMVLWWRPHPLMKSTFHSMRPQFEEEYLGLEKQYIEEGWGIYDDSSDLHRAICWSDAYYGDMSSVVRLYRVTGKPVIIQNIGIRYRNSPMACMDLVDNGDVIYVIGKCNILFELNSKNEALCLGTIGENEYFNIHSLSRNQMLFVPFYHGDIVEYTIEKRNFSSLVEMKRENLIKRMPSNHVYQHNGKLFFFGCGDDASILIFDKKTGKWHTDDLWIDKFEKLYGVRTTQYYPYDACRLSQFVWVTLREKNMVMRYDMETNESRFYKIQSSPNSFVTICYDGESFWLTGDAEEIVRWDPVSGKADSFADFPKGFEKRVFRYGAWNGWKYLFNKSLKRGNYIYFSPQRASMMIAINTKTGDIVPIKDVSEETWCFPMVKLSNGNIFFQEKGYQWECVNEYEIGMDNQCKKSCLTSRRTLKNEKNQSIDTVIQECHYDMFWMLIDGVRPKISVAGTQETAHAISSRWKSFIRSEM